MAQKIPFDTKELAVASEVPGFNTPFPTQTFTFPVSAKEGVIETYKREPIWQISGVETSYFAPKVNPDNVARAFVMDGSGFGFGSGGGPDMFGIEWEYVPAVGGSMVRPGTALMEDANDWEDLVKFPDISKWDWAESEAVNKNYFRDTQFNCCWQQNGFFERLISFMDFEGAAMAILDEDQRDAVKALFMKLADLYIDIFDEYIKRYPKIDGFFFHDDWGSQKETFFNPKLSEECIVPAMKKLTEFIHSRGRLAELHSCGQALKQVPNFAAAGWDRWDGQLMNDTHKEYELYGDKIIIGVTPDVFDPQTISEDEQRKLARDYAEKFCDPKKPSAFNSYGAFAMSPAYRQELYIASRELYGK
jgi:hypothetical protein